MSMRLRHLKLGSPVALLLPVLVLAGGVSAASAEPAADPPAEAGTAEATTREIVEATRSMARATAEWLARGIDSWFGDKSFEDGGKVTDGRLSLAVFKRQGDQPDLDLRFNAHFRLPNIEQRAYLFVGRDDLRSTIREKPEALSSQQRLQAAQPEERSFLAGLGLSLPNAIDVRLGLGSRLKPYVQARYAQSWAWGPAQSLDFRETVFWSQDERFGSTTALTYQRALRKSLALRWLGAATITQASRNFEWSSSLGAYQSLGEQRLLSVEALVYGTGTRGNGVGTSDIGLLAKWEQPIYGNALTGEIVGGHFWPRPDSVSPRGRAWALGGNLKLRF
jgi:uncharacterized protein YhjY with autotransporter beta-barrel domain